MRTFLVSILAGVAALFVSFVEFGLVAIRLSGNAVEAGTVRIIIHLVLVCGGIALIVVTLGWRSSQNYPDRRIEP